MLHLEQEDGQTGPPIVAVDTTQETESTEEDPDEPSLADLNHVDTDTLLLMLCPAELDICRYFLSCCYYCC